MMDDGWHGNGWGGGHWIAVIVMMVLFWSVVAMIVLAVIRSSGWSRHDHHAPMNRLKPRMRRRESFMSGSLVV